MIGRGRAVVALMVAAAAVLAGITSPRAGRATDPGTVQAEPRSGAWYCPHGGGEGWGAWIALANPGAAEAEIVVTTHDAADPSVDRSTLEPGRQRLVPVDASSAGASTTVEYFGTAVGAGMVVARPDDAGIASEPCVAAPGRRWYVAEGSTTRGRRTHLVIANPTGAEAVVDVALVEDQEIVEPGRLEGIVLEPGEGVGVDVGSVALGEATVTAIVTASLGEVVVSALGITESSLRSLVAVPSSGTVAAIPGAVDADEGEVIVMAPDRDLPLRADAVGPQGVRPEIEDGSVDGGTAETLGIRGGDITLVVRSEGEATFVAARRLSARTQPSAQPPPGGRDGGRDADREAPAPTPDAASVGAPAPAATVLVPSPLPPEGGRSILSLYNAASAPARVAVTLLTPDGERTPADLRDIEIGPGRTAVLGLTEAAREGPVTALVESSAGEIVATQTGVAQGGYAVTSGVAWPPVLTY